MQRILICEDQKAILDILWGISQNYIMMENLAIEVFLACTNPKELMNTLENHLHTGDLYFLDIDLKHEITGFTLAKWIRKQDPSAKIVFVTTHTELAMLTFQYQIEAMDFIIKDEEEHLKQKIISCIKTAHERYLHQPQNQDCYFTFEIHNRVEKIEYTDILFITAAKMPHKLILHTTNRQIEFYGEIKNIMNAEKGLLRCHRSFVVNCNQVQTFDKSNRVLHMKNGEICPVSLRFVKEITAKLYEISKLNV